MIARYGSSGSGTDSLGRICRGIPGAYNVALVKAVPEHLVENDFLYYLLQSDYFQKPLKGQAARSVQAGFNREGLRTILLPLPPFLEQRAIADVLGALDDKIEANVRLTRLAEQLAVARLGLGAADTHVPIGSLVEIERNQAKVSEFTSFDVEHYSLPAFDAAGTPDRCAGSSIKSNKSVLTGPVVLVSKLNPRIPRIWHAVPRRDVVALASTEFVVLRPNMGLASQELWAVTATKQFSGSLGERVTGTTGSHQRVSPEDVLKVRVPDPRLASDNSRSAVRHLVDRAAAAREESMRLARFRDALLPALVIGLLRVQAAEAVVEEAM